MSGGEMWVEDIDWIEDEAAIDEMLGGVLILFETEGVNSLGFAASSRLRAQLRSVTNPDSSA